VIKVKVKVNEVIAGELSLLIADVISVCNFIMISVTMQQYGRTVVMKRL